MYEDVVVSERGVNTNYRLASYFATRYKYE